MVTSLCNVAVLLAEVAEEESPMKPVFLILTALALITVVVLIIQAARRSVRRCVLCKDGCVPLPQVNAADADHIQREVEKYEGNAVNPDVILVCMECKAVHNCAPRDSVYLGGMSKLDGHGAAMQGIRRQTDHFGCHKCGEMLEDSDSHALSDDELMQIKKTVKRVGLPAKVSTSKFCQECGTVHYWAALGETNHGFLRIDKAIDDE